MLRKLSFFVASTIFFAMASDVDPNDILFALPPEVIGAYLVKFVKGGSECGRAHSNRELKSYKS
jgi:hypothetical protein